VNKLSGEDKTYEERKAKRDARRAKQREVNIDRALVMHKARLATELNVQLSPKISYAENQKLIVGCSGWFYWHWRDDFYPVDMPTTEWFSHYLSEFKTVELNAPFYSWPTLGTINTWRKQAGKRKVIYAVKVSELITHIKRFKGTKQLVLDFSYIADLLGPYFGCFLFQMPPSYHYAPTRLKTILSQLDHTRRNVVEFRHKSWWNESVYKAFRKTGTIFCSCSGPRLPDELIKSADDVYIRFHGIKHWYRHDYTKDELELWVKRIKASKAVRTWAYFNNDRNGYSIKNAKELMRLFKKRKSPASG
jgi:uncharacterized protein YecE (DUF72 family)